MSSPGEALENHTLIVSDGRIADLLPSPDARRAYDAVVTVERPNHLLLPGLVNAHAHVVPARGRAARPERLHDAAQLRMAQMLKAGTTCFCAAGVHPEVSARAAVEQGMRALIGLPIAQSGPCGVPDARPRVPGRVPRSSIHRDRVCSAVPGGPRR